MKDLIIIGAGVSGMNIFTIIQDINKINFEWNVIAYMDQFKKDSITQFGIPIFSSFEEIISEKNIVPEETYVISAIGSPKNRYKLMEQARERGFKIATIIHPIANISDHAKIEKGCVVCQFASIHPFAYIRKYSYIHTGDVIGPQVSIGESVTVNSLCAISANSKIGDRCYIGVGTKIIQGIIVGANSTIAAGSSVIKDVPKNCLVAGVPAQIKKENYNEK